MLLASICVGKSPAATCEKLGSVDGQSCSVFMSGFDLSEFGLSSRGLTLVVRFIVLHHAVLALTAVDEMMYGVIEAVFLVGCRIAAVALSPPAYPVISLSEL